MERWSNRVALVTGASAGIGAAICRLLIANGMKVVGCARRMDKLEALAKECPGFRPFKCDMRNDTEIQAMFEWIEKDPDLGRIDVCVANAGLAKNTNLMEGTVEQWREMMDVNVIALCLCTQLSIKSMLKHKIDDGQVIFVNSMSGHRLTPNGATRFYSSTKFAVTCLLEGWRQETRELGKNHIRVASISPGLVETEFAFAMNSDNPEKAKKLYNSMHCLQSEDMAAHVKHILELPPHVQVTDILVRPTEQRS